MRPFPPPCLALKFAKSLDLGGLGMVSGLNLIQLSGCLRSRLQGRSQLVTQNRLRNVQEFVLGGGFIPLGHE